MVGNFQKVLWRQLLQLTIKKLTKTSLTTHWVSFSSRVFWNRKRTQIMLKLVLRLLTTATVTLSKSLNQCKELCRCLLKSMGVESNKKQLLWDKALRGLSQVQEEVVIIAKMMQTKITRCKYQIRNCFHW